MRTNEPGEMLKYENESAELNSRIRFPDVALRTGYAKPDAYSSLVAHISKSSTPCPSRLDITSSSSNIVIAAINQKSDTSVYYLG